MLNSYNVYREEKGLVIIEIVADGNTIKISLSPEEWCNIVASVSFRGHNCSTVRQAKFLHGVLT